MIITTSSKEILETTNSLKICKIWKYLGKTDLKLKARVSLRELEEMKHICQLTNLITNSQLLKLFIEPILMNVWIWMIVVYFFWNFQRPSPSPHFSIREFLMQTKNFLIKENIFLFKTYVEPGLTSKIKPFAKILND